MKPIRALMLCTGNSARSIMAEAIGNNYLFDYIQFKSAGSNPIGEINPYCLLTLEKMSICTSHLESKSWNEFSKTNSWKPEIIVTLCSNAGSEPCPIWLEDIPKIKWDLEDPSIHKDSHSLSMKGFSDLFVILSLRFSYIKDYLKSSEFEAFKIKNSQLEKFKKRESRIDLISNLFLEAVNNNE